MCRKFGKRNKKKHSILTFYVTGKDYASYLMNARLGNFLKWDISVIVKDPSANTNQLKWVIKTDRYLKIANKDK